MAVGMMLLLSLPACKNGATGASSGTAADSSLASSDSITATANPGQTAADSSHATADSSWALLPFTKVDSLACQSVHDAGECSLVVFVGE